MNSIPELDIYLLIHIIDNSPVLFSFIDNSKVSSFLLNYSNQSGYIQTIYLKMSTYIPNAKISIAGCIYYGNIDNPGIKITIEELNATVDISYSEYVVNAGIRCSAPNFYDLIYNEIIKCRDSLCSFKVVETNKYMEIYKITPHEMLKILK